MTSDGKPRQSPHPLYCALREEDIEKFNAMRAMGEACDFTGLDFRAMDLREANLQGLNLAGAYFRQCDLRGQDLRSCNLEGASIHAAKISGVYFPDQLEPDEIIMSLNYGTRLRYRR
jgi:uncharacterized protein YjbI with pentapeptide repeats